MDTANTLHITDPMVINALASVRRNDLVAAQTHMHTLHPDSTEREFIGALLDEIGGNIAKALAIYQALLDEPVTPAELHIRIALSVIRLHNAHSDYESSITVATDTLRDHSAALRQLPAPFVEFHAMLACAYAETGHDTLARASIADLDSAAGLEPAELVHAQWGCADAAFALGDLARAQHHAERAREAAHTNGSPHAWAATETFVNRIRLQRADTRYREMTHGQTRAVAAFDDRPAVQPAIEAHCVLALLHALSEEPVAAFTEISIATALIQAHPDSETAPLHIDLARAYLALGDNESALDSLLRAGALLNDFAATRSTAKVWRDMGELHERLGDMVAANACYKAALDNAGITALVSSIPER